MSLRIGPSLSRMATASLRSAFPRSKNTWSANRTTKPRSSCSTITEACSPSRSINSPRASLSCSNCSRLSSELDDNNPGRFLQPNLPATLQTRRGWIALIHGTCLHPRLKCQTTAQTMTKAGLPCSHRLSSTRVNPIVQVGLAAFYACAPVLTSSVTCSMASPGLPYDNEARTHSVFPR